MILERVVRRGRQRVDRIARDETLDVEHVAVFRVLRPGRGPERPLQVRTFGLQLFESIGGKDLLELLVGQLGVRDGNFAEKRLQLLIARFFHLRFDLLVSLRVDAADKKAGHRADLVDREIFFDAAFEPAEIGLHHLAVNVI